jgi:hypothetical protein
MKNHPLVISTLLCAFVISMPVFSQPSLMGTMSGYDTVRIMDYNVLNYPGSDTATRNPYFRRVIHSVKPDVLVVLEMTSQTGVNTFLNSVLNYYQPGSYSTISFHDGPDTDPHIYFKTSKVTFIDTNFISTALRNIGEFIIKINSSSDTLHLFAVHLKASSGSSNEQLRLAEATILRNYTNNLPSGTKFMIMGDFNMYTSDEPAFVKLTESEADNDGRTKDPINQLGNWNSNIAFAPYHTQSPRVRAFGGGSTGGMDDRFDLILTSYSSLDSNTIVSSYKAYGNDGNHLNDSINKLPNAAVPDSVANGLHYASDHIPVICDFKFGTSSIGSFSLSSPSNGATNRTIAGTLSWTTSAGATGYDVYLGTSNPPTTKVSSNQPGISYSYSGLSNSTSYYWKVVAKNSTDSITATGSPWSFTTIIAPPAAFSMASPANGATSQSVSGTLTWLTSTNATGYDVYLGTTNPPTSKVSSNQPSTSLNYVGLLNNTLYYWKIVARNVNDTIVATGAPWSFTTIQASPAAFTLSFPTNSAINQTISGSLSWVASANATGYDVYLGTTNPPTTKVSSNQSGTSYNYNDLSYSTIYYWNVVAKNAIDSIQATGSPWSFTTELAPPGPFTLLSPANASTGQQLSGVLRWAFSANSSAYDIYLGTANPPTTKIDSNLIDTMYSYSNLIPDSTYYWAVVAKNISGSESASGSPWRFTIASLPHAPSGVSVSDRSVSNLDIGWTDNASNELGYRIYRASDEHGPYSQIDGDLPPNTVAFKDSLLGVNQRYYYQVVPFNEFGEGQIATITAATLAVVPGEPMLTNILSQSLTVTLLPNGNPSHTQFAISLNDSTATEYVQAEGSTGVIPVWRTHTEWGGSNGISVSGLNACQTYAISVRARNLDSLETAEGGTASAVMLCNASSVSVSEGWNLISVPVKVSDNRKSILFPTAQSSAFTFNGSYSTVDTLVHGIGYWIKFGGDESIALFGDYRASDTLQLVKGWNLVGSISSPVNILSITTDPIDIIISNFYSYSNGYAIADTLYPAQGYWVKSSSNGKLILTTP